MALPKSSMIFFLVMAMFGVCYGAVYKVGDSEGWRYKGFDYQAWRLNKNFTVGDSLCKFFLPFDRFALVFEAI